MQLFVVDKKDKKSGTTSAVYVFDNHAAALRCRHELRLSSDHLRGCVINSDWRNGQPIAQNVPAPKSKVAALLDWMEQNSFAGAVMIVLGLTAVALVFWMLK